MTPFNFARFGARPLFDKPLPVGQLYFPSWERYEAASRGIFERQYYNNNGPLHSEFESRLQEFLKVKHAICVANATLGLMMVADAMQLKGKVILPAFTFIASAQALSWAGLEPVFCDIDLNSHQMDISKIETLIDDDVCAIMGVNLWGGACDPKALGEIATARGLRLFFDSAHAFGVKIDDTSIGNFGEAEVFSFHATKVLSATEGGCICTNDDQLAARLRSIRPSYGGDAPVNVLRVANARMSEAQAAVGLMNLEDFPAHQKNNAALFSLYQSELEGIPGLHVCQPSGVSFSNFQYAPSVIDEAAFGLSRDNLVALLQSENVISRRYFYPGIHRGIPYAQEFPQYVDALPNTDAVCASCMQLPIGALVEKEGVRQICDFLRRAHEHAPAIQKMLGV
jgi:dTDP-4-amino-4,6-dideoxygalactose transaminase